MFIEIFSECALYNIFNGHRHVSVVIKCVVPVLSQSVSCVLIKCVIPVFSSSVLFYVLMKLFMCSCEVCSVCVVKMFPVVFFMKLLLSSCEVFPVFFLKLVLPARLFSGGVFCK